MSARYTKLGQLEGKFGFPAREYLTAHDFGGNCTYLFPTKILHPQSKISSLELSLSGHPVCSVPTFNSCTKCVGSLGIIHDMPPSFLGKGAWMTSQMNATLIRKLRRSFSLMCLAYFLTCYIWVLKQSGTDRRPVDRCRN